MRYEQQNTIKLLIDVLQHFTFVFCVDLWSRQIVKSKQFKRLVKQIKACPFFAKRVDEALLPFFPGSYFLLQAAEQGG